MLFLNVVISPKLSMKQRELEAVFIFFLTWRVTQIVKIPRNLHVCIVFCYSVFPVLFWSLGFLFEPASSLLGLFGVTQILLLSFAKASLPSSTHKSHEKSCGKLQSPLSLCISYRSERK